MLTTPPHSFLHTTLGGSQKPLFRLGLSATYRPGKDAILHAAERGVNFFFYFGIDTQMVTALRELVRRDRERIILATGAYNLIFGHTDVRRTLEKRLRQLKTDFIDLFMFLGVMKEKEFPSRVYEQMVRLREEGKVGQIGISTHDRKFAGRLAANGALDVLMVRYNAAHRGAEEEIFPWTHAHNTGVVGYTATRWTYLLRRPKGFRPEGAPPTAGQCYRFVLSHPDVDVCLTAPRNIRELDENIDALAHGPLSSEEMMFMRTFGDAVHHTKRWFM